MIARRLRQQVFARIPISLDYCEPPIIEIAQIDVVEPKAAPLPKSTPLEPTAQTTLGMY